jgi:hypothetical protein
MSPATTRVGTIVSDRHPGLRDDLVSSFSLEQKPQSRADDRMIVGEHERDASRGASGQERALSPVMERSAVVSP